MPLARWPAVDEALAFIEDYERVRGTAFTAAERRAVHLACVYLIAYAARCHHAFGGDPGDVGLAAFAGALL